MDLNNLNWSVEYYEEHIEECNSILKSLDDFEKIPLLDSVSLQTITDGMLIRYRGMIQDALNPEYYCDFTVKNKESNETYVRSGKYRDVASCKVNEELYLNEVDFLPRERFVYFCIPIPGSNDWVDDLQKTENSNEQNDRCSSHLKRTASDTETEMEIETTESTSQNNTKRSKSSTTGQNTELQNNVYDYTKYFPVVNRNKNNIPCIVKVYEEDENTEFSLNDCIEIIGFVSLNPALEANCEVIDGVSEDKAHHPPPSLVPRIHVIHKKKLRHNNPLLKQITSNEDITCLAEDVRSDLHLIFTQLLFEDALAADYMICHLISKIYIRNESNTIGKFSLNLFNISLKNFAEEFYNILKMLVTNSHYIPLTINLLNEKSFVPRKDYEINRLCSGVLQLPKETHLVLDETKMNEGQLNNIGCLNVAAIQRLFRDQEVYYDFGYFPFKYETDIPLLVISEGKSMFEADIRLKVKSELCTETNFNESLEAVRLYLNDDFLKKIRIYLTAVRLENFELGEEMVQKIGEDYVSLRQQDREVNSFDLHALLILSRLLALSHGRTGLKPEDWSKAIEMETERKSRMR